MRGKNKEASSFERKSLPCWDVTTSQANGNWSQCSCELVWWSCALACETEKRIIYRRKKFNRGGFDVHKRIWHDMRTERPSLHCHYRGRSGIIVFFCISSKGIPSFEFVPTTPSSIGYATVLKEYLQQFVNWLGDFDLRLTQDNAPFHGSHSMRTRLTSFRMSALTQSAFFPDLISIKNIWGYLDRAVCENSW